MSEEGKVGKRFQKEVAREIENKKKGMVVVMLSAA